MCGLFLPRMDVIEFRTYCLSLPHAEESTPFDETTLVYKVGGKMFAYADMVDFRQINVKCDPDEAIELRERYPEVVPGYHASKKHWNSLLTHGRLTDVFIREQIYTSYKLVIAGLPKVRQKELLGG